MSELRDKICQIIHECRMDALHSLRKEVLMNSAWGYTDKILALLPEEREPVAWQSEVDWGDGRGWICATAIYGNEKDATDSYVEALKSVPGSKGRAIPLYRGVTDE